MAAESEIFEHVRFEATLDDAVDVAQRYQKHSPAVRRARRNDIAATVASTSIGCFAVAVLVSKIPVLAGLALTIPVGLLALAVYPLIHDRIVAGRTRRVVREGMPGANTMPIEIKLTSLGIVLQAANDSMTVEWPRVMRITDVPEGIEIVAEAAVVMVRARAFASPEDRARFLTRANSLKRLATPPADPFSTPVARG